MDWFLTFKIISLAVVLVLIFWVYFFSKYGKYILQRHRFLIILFWSTILLMAGWFGFIEWRYQNRLNDLIVFGHKVYGIDTLIIIVPQISSFIGWNYILKIKEKTNYEKDYVYKMNKQNPALAYRLLFLLFAIFLFMSIYQTIDNRCFGCYPV
jgi:hypothetical protein